jgi:hypothetical protein
VGRGGYSERQLTVLKECFQRKRTVFSNIVHFKKDFFHVFGMAAFTVLASVVYFYLRNQ